MAPVVGLVPVVPAGRAADLDRRIAVGILSAAAGGRSPVVARELVDGLGVVLSVRELIWAYVAAMRGSGLSESTVRTRVNVLLRVVFVLGHPMRLGAAQLEGWLADRGLSATSARLYGSHLRSFYDWLVAQGMLPVSPMPPRRRGSGRRVRAVSPGGLRVVRRSRPPVLGWEERMTARMVRAAAAGARSPLLTPEFLDGLGEVQSVADLVRAFVRFMRGAGLAESTIQVRVELLVRVARRYGHPFGLTRDQLSQFLGRPGLARWTRTTYFTQLRSFYEWAVDEELLTRSPMVKMRKPRARMGVPRPAPLEAFHRLLAGAEPWATGVALAGYAGLRMAEICRLHREDVTAEHITVMGKGGREANVPTHPLLWARLRDRPAGLLVPDRYGEPYGRRACWAFNRHVRSLGLAPVTMHQFRHLYGTMLLRQTQNLRLVQELMRHASPATTAIYTEVSEPERSAAIRDLDLGDGSMS